MLDKFDVDNAVVDDDEEEEAGLLAVGPGDGDVGAFSLCGDSGAWDDESSSIDDTLPCA